MVELQRIFFQKLYGESRFQRYNSWVLQRPFSSPEF